MFTLLVAAHVAGGAFLVWVARQFTGVTASVVASTTDACAAPVRFLYNSSALTNNAAFTSTWASMSAWQNVIASRATDDGIYV